jgi:hypothetical protein
MTAEGTVGAPTCLVSSTVFDSAYESPNNSVHDLHTVQSVHSLDYLLDTNYNRLSTHFTKYKLQIKLHTTLCWKLYT